MSEQTSPPKDSNEVSDQDRAAYFMNEFFFSMLPCYIFLVTAVIRYFRVKDKQIKYHEFAFDETLMSFKIKVRICQFQAITYAVSLILGVASSPLLFWGAKFGWSNLFYVFGIIAWVVSFILLEFEYVREQNQALYGHRVFWIFSFCFSAMRLFQDYMALFNIIISVARTVPNFVLLMYAMYKPFDKSSQDYDDETPSFARIFFEKFENNPIIAKLLRYTINRTSKQSSFHKPLMVDVEMQEQPNGFIDTFFQETGDYEVTQSSIDLERRLYNNLPRKIVVVNSKAETKIELGKQKIYYTIITTIGNNPYRVSKRYNDFIEIYKDLSEIYSPQNYTKLDKSFPILEKIEHTDQDRERKRIQSIQNWLNEVFKYPLFMHKLLLDFLNVEQDSQSAFIVYFQHVSKMKGNKNPVLTKQNKSQEQPASSNYNDQDLSSHLAYHLQHLPQQSKLHQIIQHLCDGNQFTQFTNCQQINQKLYLNKDERMMRYNSTAQQLIDTQKIIQARKDSFSFEISCKNAEKSQFGNTLQYVFEIVFIPKTGQQQRWTFSKTMTEMKELNQELEEELDINVTYFSSIQNVWAIKDSNDKQNIKKKVEALNSYMSSLLKQKAFYCKPLFDFIEFDPQREIHYNSRMCTPRQTILHHENDDALGNQKGSSTLSQYQGITDEREPGLKTQVNSGLKGVNLLKEFSLINEADFQRNQQILEQRDNSKERFVYGINLNRVIISVQKIMTKSIQSAQFKNETRLVTQYLIYLEEFDTFGIVVKQIKLLKEYNQIKQLDDNLKSVYRHVNMNYVGIPYDRTPSNQFIADEMKKEFDIYFEGLLKLSFVEKNPFFENFFHLKELTSVRKVSHSGIISYDFTQGDDI